MASIKPHKSGWRAHLCVNGKRLSKVFRTKREAEAWASVTAAQVIEDAGKSEGERHTLAEAMKRYRDEVSPKKRGERFDALRIDVFLRSDLLPIHSKIADIKTRDLLEWRDQRLSVVKPGSVLREISVLSAIFETARREWEWIEKNPVADMRKPAKPPHRDIIITRPQIRRMLIAMGHKKGPCKSVRDAVSRCFLLALRTGMRAGEICNLTWSNVHENFCLLPVTKTKPRTVDLSPKAKRIINSMQGWDETQVFGIKNATLDAMFRKYRAKAGLAGFTFHDARHTAATWLSVKLDVLSLCKMFGWANPSQAMVYYNPRPGDMAKRL